MEDLPRKFPQRKFPSRFSFGSRGRRFQIFGVSLSATRTGRRHIVASLVLESRQSEKNQDSRYPLKAGIFFQGFVFVRAGMAGGFGGHGAGDCDGDDGDTARISLHGDKVDPARHSWKIPLGVDHGVLWIDAGLIGAHGNLGGRIGRRTEDFDEAITQAVPFSGAGEGADSLAVVIAEIELPQSVVFKTGDCQRNLGGGAVNIEDFERGRRGGAGFDMSEPVQRRDRGTRDQTLEMEVSCFTFRGRKRNGIGADSRAAGDSKEQNGHEQGLRHERQGKKVGFFVHASAKSLLIDFETRILTPR